MSSDSGFAPPGYGQADEIASASTATTQTPAQLPKSTPTVAIVSKSTEPTPSKPDSNDDDGDDGDDVVITTGPSDMSSSQKGTDIQGLTTLLSQSFSGSPTKQSVLTRSSVKGPASTLKANPASATSKPMLILTPLPALSSAQPITKSSVVTPSRPSRQKTLQPSTQNSRKPSKRPLATAAVATSASAPALVFTPILRPTFVQPFGQGPAKMNATVSAQIQKPTTVATSVQGSAQIHAPNPLQSSEGLPQFSTSNPVPPSRQSTSRVHTPIDAQFPPRILVQSSLQGPSNTHTHTSQPTSTQPHIADHTQITGNELIQQDAEMSQPIIERSSALKPVTCSFSASFDYHDRPSNPFNQVNRRSDSVCLIPSNSNQSQFASSDGQRLATHIDRSIESSTRYFANEWQMYYEGGEQQKQRSLENSLNSLKVALMEVGAKVAGEERKAPQNLMNALRDCAAAVEKLKDSQVAATQKAEAAHVEFLSEIRKGQAELVKELQQNKADTTKCQTEIIHEIEQSRDEVRRNKAEIEAKVSQSQIKIEDGIQQTRFAVLDEQSDTSVKIEGELREVKELIIRASIDRALSNPLRPSMPSTKDHSLIIFVKLDNGDPFEDYARLKKSIIVRVDKTQGVSEIIEILNQTYDRPARDTPSSESKLFTLKYIIIPGEQGEVDERVIANSGTWAAWVNNVLVHKEDQVKVAMVFKLVVRPVQPSKKRKIDGDGQAQLVDSDNGTGRNFFRTYNW